jgi:hypothetical protein
MDALLWCVEPRGKPWQPGIRCITSNRGDYWHFPGFVQCRQKRSGGKSFWFDGAAAVIERAGMTGFGQVFGRCAGKSPGREDDDVI